MHFYAIINKADLRSCKKRITFLFYTLKTKTIKSSDSS